MYSFNGFSGFRADRVMGAFLETTVATEPLDRRPLPNAVGLIDPLTSWYRRWYFLVRLDDALELSRRDVLELGLVLVKVPLLADGSPQIGTLRLREELLFAGHWCLRFHDVPGTLNSQELAVFLPDSGEERTSEVAAKLKSRLREFSPRVGTAVSPQDGWLTEQLIARARAEARRDCSSLG